MPQAATETKRVVVSVAGDPDDTLFEIDVEPGATPASIFAAMGLEKTNGSYAYQLTKPGPSSGVFADSANVFANVKPGDKLTAVPKTKVAAS